MGIATDWIEDRHLRLYYGGTMPESYLDDGFASPPQSDFEDMAPSLDHDRSLAPRAEAWAKAA